MFHISRVGGCSFETCGAKVFAARVVSRVASVPWLARFVWDPGGLLHVSSSISWGCWRIHIPLVKYSNSMCLTCLYELASIGINSLVGQKVGWHYGFPLFPVM